MRDPTELMHGLLRIELERPVQIPQRGIVLIVCQIEAAAHTVEQPHVGLEPDGLVEIGDPAGKILLVDGRQASPGGVGGRARQIGHAGVDRAVAGRDPAVDRRALVPAGL
jgi:hypothetical protein